MRRRSGRASLYVLESFGLDEDLCDQSVIPKNICAGVAHVRVLTGPLAGTMQEVPEDSVKKKTAAPLTLQGVLWRVIAEADDDGSCRLCGRTHQPGTVDHEAGCPIPDARKVLAQRSTKRAKAEDLEDDVEDDLEDAGTRQTKPRKTKPRRKRRGPTKRRPGR